MPRHPDPGLEERILNAARKLWIHGGDKALSMRTLARAARTNTPAVYRRFRNRNEILRALAQKTQQELFTRLEGCGSLQELWQCALEFILAHPAEYKLMIAGLFFRAGEPRPSFELMKRRSAELLGGSPEDHAEMVLALLALVYGTATLMISNAIPQGYEKKLCPVVTEAVELLVNNAVALSVRK
jgi:AcrR family transcriptional regulator